MPAMLPIFPLAPPDGLHPIPIKHENAFPGMTVGTAAPARATMTPQFLSAAHTATAAATLRRQRVSGNLYPNPAPAAATAVLAAIPEMDNATLGTTTRNAGGWVRAFDNSVI